MEKELIKEDVDCLIKMVDAQEKMEDVFKPVAFTSKNDNDFILQLKEKGIKKLITDGYKHMHSIGACNFPPLQQIGYNLNKSLTAKTVNNEQHDLLLKALTFLCENPDLQLLPHELSLNDLNESAYKMCDYYGKLSGAGSLNKLSISDAIYPESTFTINGNKYSYFFLYYYIRYAYCCQFIDFDKVDNIVELGSGSGRFVEVIKNFHPHINFYLLDLAPELYTAHHFLKATFPDSVIPFDPNFTQIEGKGKICTLMPDMIEKIQPVGSTVSVNLMVLSILSKSQAEIHLKKMKEFSQAILICEPTTDDTAKIYDLEDAITYDLYDSLLNDFDMVNRSKSFKPLSNIKGWGGVDNMMWVNKNNKSAIKNIFDLPDNK